MGSRRLHPMSVADLGRLPEPCGLCVLGEPGRSDHATPADRADRRARATEWARAVTDHWGCCGVIAVANDEIIGYLTMAPSDSGRRLGPYVGRSVSPDVAVLLTVQVVTAWQGKGVGRQLVHTAAGLLTRRDLRVVEAVGTHQQGPSCMMPVPWLEAVGFTVVRAHPVTPRLQMDLQNTVRWRADLGAAWHRLTDLVTPAAPEPASYTGRKTFEPGGGSRGGRAGRG